MIRTDNPNLQFVITLADSLREYASNLEEAATKGEDFEIIEILDKLDEEIKLNKDRF